METKTFHVGVICTAFYKSELQVSADMTADEAWEYAQNHLDDIPVGDLEWVGDCEVDDPSNCHF